MHNSTVALAANELIDERLQANAEIHFTVPTASMYPMLMPGEQIVVRGISADQLHLGDMVLVKSENAWLTHRLIGRIKCGTKLLYITKGDNQIVPDTLWTAEQLRGIVIAIQKPERILNLESKRIAGLNWILATLSQVQLLVNRIPESTIRRIGVKFSRAGLDAGARLARRLAE
jgi:signal peptidase I